MSPSSLTEQLAFLHLLSCPCWEAILISPFFLIPNPITHWILLTQVLLRNSQNSFASVHIHTCQHIQALIISYWTTVIAS